MLSFLHSIYRNKNHKKTIGLLHELLQPETYQKMLERRSKSFNHTPISIAILNGSELTEELLQQVTTKNLLTYDFENNRYLHLSIREGLWYISKKLIELDQSLNTDGFLFNENSFGQTPTEIAIQTALNQIVTTNIFEEIPSKLPPELDFNNDQDKKKGEKDETIERSVKKSFDLMVPFYLPRNQGNLSSKRVWINLDEVNNMINELTEKISSESKYKEVTSKEKNLSKKLKINLIRDSSIACKISLTK